MSDQPDFQRPPVSEWMSPPKSSNLPVWRPSTPDEESSSRGWSTPPRSRKTNSYCGEHFSLHLSPDVSITLHSPKSVNAYVTSKNDVGNKKFSLKILSPRHRRRKESLPTEELLSDNADLLPCSPDPVPDINAKTVHKTVLREFIPPSYSGKESKKEKQKVVKKIQMTDFKPAYSFSPPRKLSPEKSKLQNQAVGTPRKRHIDVKSAQDYILAQRKKRSKMALAEKSRKKIDSEEKKKKLEELHLRSLQLATACRRKKPATTCSQIKMVDNEDDLTLSLGLRQVKPKRSFQESLASLGKPVQVLPPKQEEEIDLVLPPEEMIEESKENFVPYQYQSEMRKLSRRLTPRDDASETIIQLAETLQKRIAEKSNRRKMQSIENLVEPKRVKTVAVDAETMTSLTNEIKEIACGFQALQSALVDVNKQRQPDWIYTIEPHPYNIFTAVRNKLLASGKSKKPEKSDMAQPVVEILPESEKSVLQISLNPGESKPDSGSEFSSSILDSEKKTGESSISEQISSFRPNVVLMPTLGEAKLNNTVKTDDIGKSVTQVIDNLSGSSEKEEKVSNLTRSDPFQALLDSEFHVLDSLQKNLARCVENQRNVAVNTDLLKNCNDRCVQTSTVSSKNNSIRTEMDLESVENTSTGMSLEMLTRMIKDEEIRSEHQLALIQLRQHALVEKTKAGLSLLEQKKKSIKNAGVTDGPMSAIKKKQRGILLRYQSEQQEIERLKRMHQIASQERCVMVRQQEQIHQMQLSTQDIMSKLNQKKSNSSGSEIAEDIPSSSTESINTFIQHSENVSSDEILSMNQNILRERIKSDAEKLNKCRKFLDEKEQTLMQQKHFVQEILEWEQRLDAEETRIKEMKKRALRAAQPTPFLRDRSTSPVKLTESESKVSSAVSIPEALSVGSDEITKPTVRSYTSESFESSSDVQKSTPIAKNLPIVKPALSPRQGSRRRYSSGSDDSANLSHTETTSEPSDVECRLKALEEQLKCRKMEADRLRREHKRKQRERLKEKEESLKKQIEAYDVYINKLKSDVEQESRNASPIIKPVIKHSKKIQIEEKSISEEVEESDSPIIESEEIGETTLLLDEEEISEKIVSKIESVSYDADSFESDDETLKQSVNAESVVDQLLDQFLDECVDIVGGVFKKQKQRTVESVTDYLSQAIFKDALNEVFGIYTKRQKRNEENEVTWDVRRRIHEIMGAQIEVKNRNCDQSTLQTTYDVSPANSPTSGNGFFEQQEFISSLSEDQKEVHVAHDSDGQEWFDEDFGLTKSRREAEALRLQQLQIEQEIEELQAQQEQVPYFYLREIPNKPPPPYTPPCKPTAPNVPTSETEITRQMQDFARNAFKMLHGDENPGSLVKPDLSQHFTQCLWDLAQELVSEACSSIANVDTEDPLPWNRHPQPLAKWRQTRRSLLEDIIIDEVVQQSLMLFGLRPRVEQETLIVRWSRKKRDHVDELLVWDSQAEEAEWTWYDQEVVQVKNEVADQLMDTLLEETASIFTDILKKKGA